MIYDVFRLNNGCDLEVHSKVTTVFVQKLLKVSLILGVIISLDLTGHSLRAKSGLSAEMGTKPQLGKWRVRRIFGFKPVRKFLPCKSSLKCHKLSNRF